LKRYSCLCTTILNNGKKEIAKDVAVIVKANEIKEAKIKAKEKIKKMYGKQIKGIMVERINLL